MNQLTKTGIFVGVAAVLALLAAFVVPSGRMPSLFNDQGQPFFKQFSPLNVGSIEITGFREDQAQPRPFKVELANNRWIIPSAQGYVADVKDRVARVAALMVDLKKGDLRGDRESDFEKYGLADPHEETRGSTKGRGRRVTLKDQSGAVLADLIVGKQIEDKYGYYYVREPGSKRVYTCRIDGEAISTRFADWVETDVLKLGSSQLKKIAFDNYKVRTERISIRQFQDRTKKGETKNILAAYRSGLDEVSVVQRANAPEVVTVDRDSAGIWTLEGGLPAGHETDKEKLDTASSTLSALTLVGVRRRPSGLLQLIAKLEKQGDNLSEDEVADLQNRLKQLTSRGYYPVQSETGALAIYGAEGEIRVACDDGVVYTLRLGDMIMGDEDELANATAAAKTPTTGPTSRPGREHRYLFVTVDFDPSLLGPKPTPPTTRPSTRPTTMAAATTQPTTMPVDPAVTEYENKLKEYDKKVADGKKRRDELATKFDEWYYIVSADAYAKLKLDRGSLLKAVPTTQPTTQPTTMPTTQP